jgi:stage V sporulation protein SpoVS
MRTFSTPVNTEPLMSQSAAPNPQADAARDAAQLEAATDEAIAACGGSALDAVRALIVANEYLELEVCDLMRAVSQAFVRGRFKTYSG